VTAHPTTDSGRGVMVLLLAALDNNKGSDAKLSLLNAGVGSVRFYKCAYRVCCRLRTTGAGQDISLAVYKVPACSRIFAPSN
jgi:hypothetical protein